MQGAEYTIIADGNGVANIELNLTKDKKFKMIFTPFPPLGVEDSLLNKDDYKMITLNGNWYEDDAGNIYLSFINIKKFGVDNLFDEKLDKYQTVKKIKRNTFRLSPQNGSVMIWGISCTLTKK